MSERNLFIFIDSLGWEILNNHSFLNDCVQTRVPLKTPLGYSSAAVPTILSGRVPSQHGHWSFYFYSPKTSPFKWLRPLAWLPPFIREKGRVRNVLSRIAKRLLRITGYFQLYNTPFQYIHLFDYCEKKDIFRPGGFNSGESIFDVLKTREIKYFVSDWHQNDDANLRAAKEAFVEQNIAFGFLYLNELDAHIHRVGTKHGLISEKLDWYEKKIKQLYEEVRRKGQFNLYIFSDHGQADVHTIVDIEQKIESLGLRFGRDYVAYYDSTMARFWFLRPTAEKQICDELEKIFEGKILSDSELETLGAFWDDHRFGDLIFLVNPGVLIVPSFMGKTPMAAMHGYHPADPSADGIFLSNVCLKKRPAHLKDIFPLMVKAIEI